MESFGYDPDTADMLHVEEGPDLNEADTTSRARGFTEADLDDLVDEFIEVVNARDFVAVERLLAPTVEAGFLDDRSRPEVIEGLGDLGLRNPSLVLTRGDLGPEPIVAAWIFDTDSDRYTVVGYLSFELAEGPEPLIERLEYVAEFSDSAELIVEEPGRSDLPEWDDWSVLDET